MAKSPEKIQKRRERRIQNAEKRFSSFGITGPFTRDDLIRLGYRSRGDKPNQDLNSASAFLNNLVGFGVLQCDHVSGGLRVYWRDFSE